MEKGSSKNYELEIGSNQFIPGFEEKDIKFLDFFKIIEQLEKHS